MGTGRRVRTQSREVDGSWSPWSGQAGLAKSGPVCWTGECAEAADARGRAREDEVAWLDRDELGHPDDDIDRREDQLAGV